MAWTCSPATGLILQCENPGLVSVLGFLMTPPTTRKSASYDSVSEKENTFPLPAPALPLAPLSGGLVSGTSGKS